MDPTVFTQCDKMQKKDKNYNDIIKPKQLQKCPGLKKKIVLDFNHDNTKDTSGINTNINIYRFIIKIRLKT